MNEVPKEWEMFSDEGDNAVTAMMQEIKDALRSKPLPEIRKLLKQRIDEIAKEHAEVYDTDVREIIVSRLTKWACQANGLKIGFELDLDYWDL